MKLTGHLDSDTVTALVRESLERRFSSMRVSEVDLGYISRATFELSDESEPVATPVEPLTADNF